ncbi:MAG: hypothetical protein ACOYXC_00765 [Candidatus Rifleibacteriota bacterium]
MSLLKYISVMFKNFSMLMMIFIFCLWQPHYAVAGQIASDLAFLEELVDQAVKNLELDHENAEGSQNIQQFVENAGLKLKMAQASSSRPGFLDSDYFNLGVYLVTISFKRFKAAEIVLKRQLLIEKEPVVRKWLEKRLFVLKRHTECEKNLTVETEIKEFKEMFN